MRLLLDTHVLLWATSVPGRRTPELRALLESPDTAAVFSPATIWEVAIKSQTGRSDFLVDPEVLRTTLVEVGCFELPITSAHAAAAAHLPPIHKDPFDRILIAQAQVEGITLLTADRTVARYPGPIRLLERQADR